MNQSRRIQLKKIVAELQKLTQELENLNDQLEQVRDEEEEAYNFIPDGLCDSDRAMTIERIIDELTFSYEEIYFAQNRLNKAIETLENIVY